MKSHLPASQSSAAPRGLRVEPLESRICPSAVVLTPGSHLLHSGDTGTDGTGNVIVQVSGGQALVFVTDNVSANGAYDPGELTGISLGDHSNLLVNDTVNGDIVTNLDNDGTLSGAGDTGATLLDSSVSGITVHGSVNKILVGHDLTNTTVTSATEIRNGTAAGGQSFDFGAGSVALAAFTPADGSDGGAITNLTVTAGAGPLTIHVGDGGDSALKKGGDAGKFKNVSVTTAGDVEITGGQGGDGFKGGGKGTEFDTFDVTASGAGSDIHIDAGGGGTILNVANAKGSGGEAGDILRGTLDAGGLVAINTAGGAGGDATKKGGAGSSLEQISVTAVGDITLIGTHGGSALDNGNLDGEKGRGGLGGHISGQLTYTGHFTTVQTTSGTITILAGDAGSGGRGGYNGGSIFGLDINPSATIPVPAGDVTIVAGHGGNFDASTGSHKGNGGYGGTINSVAVSTTGNVTMTGGNGGISSSTAREGGTVSFIQVRQANNVTLLGGQGGGSNTFPTGDDENTDVGGDGGSVTNIRVGGLPGNSITGDVTLTGGAGYGTVGSNVDLRTGGVGGSIIDAIIETNGNILLTAGNGGSADTDKSNISSSRGGDGGLIDPLILTGANVTLAAGTGGTGISRGGDGGEISRLTIASTGLVNIAAGHGGGDVVAPQPKTGGDGGDARNFDITLSGGGSVGSITAGLGGGGSSSNGDDGEVISVNVVNAVAPIDNLALAESLGSITGSTLARWQS